MSSGQPNQIIPTQVVKTGIRRDFEKATDLLINEREVLRLIGLTVNQLEHVWHVNLLAHYIADPGYIRCEIVSSPRIPSPPPTRPTRLPTTPQQERLERIEERGERKLERIKGRGERRLERIRGRGERRSARLVPNLNP